MPTNDAVPVNKLEYLRLIETRLKAFRSGVLADNAINLLNALGYRSDKTLGYELGTAAGLLELASRKDFFSHAKARPEEWLSVDLLFQLTDEEVRDYGQTALAFDSKRLDVNSATQIETYIFFALELKPKEDGYSRTSLADITREINRLFPMPALVLFKHGDTLTLSVINRRLHKRDAARDVLEKVTLIKDIRIENTHRAHVEILYDLAFPQLAALHTITNFVELHDAWRRTLDISELNRRFYKDLANWYFWAREHVEFPAGGAGVSDEMNRATNVIRLITRLIFVWFLKERQLVPDDLFRPEYLSGVLKDLSPKSSTFYKAILQNLFFATLNTPMHDAAHAREFRTDTGAGKRFNDQYMVHNQYRHKKLFRDPDAALKLFASVPFLNGGLFECLDKSEDVKGKLVETRVDGFSDVERKQPTVPNRLFFCEEHNCADDGVDLNVVYGTRSKTYKVRGLIDTLNRYKFTIAENTPIEEEVALDPELLGKVFENLLASYNPETGATARKQTGSFYTPREIVNYMVDESLLAYLETQLAPPANGAEPEGEPLNARLRRLFAYTDEAQEFTDAEVEQLIKAIDGVKILDPACGSGAFPMGILGKLVFILARLDPQNAKWKQRQIDRVRALMREAQKIEDDQFRESTLQDLEAQIGNIEEAFERNELDYGRKLYLIENCIYGVDIQPIAIQISKLRFFISLIIDQRIRPAAENLGIRPLPNLETKFIAANTLLSLEKPAKAFLRNTAIDEKERELKIVRERYFTARTTRTKEKYHREDERLRREIGALLESEGNFPHETTAKLIAWNPYDQNASADFFDAEWMFGVPDGFDVVIGNPPYVRGTRFKELKAFFKKNFVTAQYQVDLYVLFIEKGIKSLNRAGTISYITPNSWLKNLMMSDCRKFILDQLHISSISPNIANAFAAQVDTSILVASRNKNMARLNVVEFDNGQAVLKKQVDQNRFLNNEKFIFDVEVDERTSEILSKVRADNKTLDDVADVSFGFRAYDLYAGQSEHIVRDKPYTSQTKASKSFEPYIIGKDVNRFSYRIDNRHFVKWGNWLAAPRDEKYFTGERIVMREILGDNFVCTIISEDLKIDRSLYIAKPFDKSYKSRFILAVLASRLLAWFFRHEKNEFDALFPKIRLQEFKSLPIPKATESRQAVIVTLVDQILAARRKDPSANTGELERKIDRLVYQLYDLTPDEIAIVEASAGK
jgi:type I restriction-modification system DNA methylase subunit